MNSSTVQQHPGLTVGKTYRVFNPRYGNFTGKLAQLSLQEQEAVIEHDVAGVPHETDCNLAYCSFELVQDTGATGPAVP
jgi:hypothetical protein